MDYAFDEDAEEIVFERLDQLWKKTGQPLSDDDQLRAEQVTTRLKEMLQDLEEPDLPIVLAALLRVMMPMLIHIEVESWEQTVFGQKLNQNGL